MALQYKDYYQALGVQRGAADAEIKRAFRKLAREYHPDTAKNKRLAEEKFKEINEAYEVLGDPEKRRQYDSLGSGWRPGSDFSMPPGWQRGAGTGSRRANGQEFEFQFGGSGFSDFFEQLFGGRARARRGFEGMAGSEDDPELERGNDIEGDLRVTLEEARSGAVRAVTVRHNEVCRACEGTALRGRRPCAECGGTGQLPRTNTYQVKIPAGVTEGQRLRVAGRGEVGVSGRVAGDLYLRVRLAKHPDFQVDGHNLVHELDLAPWEAVLGAQVAVPLVEGSVEIRIPPGTQNGMKLRLRGRGLPRRDGSAGDLIVVARVQLPPAVNQKQRALWEQLGAESNFDPRSDPS